MTMMRCRRAGNIVALERCIRGKEIFFLSLDEVCVGRLLKCNIVDDSVILRLMRFYGADVMCLLFDWSWKVASVREYKRALGRFDEFFYRYLKLFIKLYFIFRTLRPLTHIRLFSSVTAVYMTISCMRRVYVMVYHRRQFFKNTLLRVYSR